MLKLPIGIRDYVVLEGEQRSELTIEEIDGVSGGNPIAAGAAVFFAGWLANKTLDSLSKGKSVQDIAKGYAQQRAARSNSPRADFMNLGTLLAD